MPRVYSPEKPCSLCGIGKRYKDTHCESCYKQHRREYGKYYRDSRKEELATKFKAWYEINTGLLAQSMRRKSNALKKVGWTLNRFLAFNYAQQGLCAICHEPETNSTRGEGYNSLAADHNHKTGQLRALVCANCNRALGLAQESPEILRAMANYIEEWEGRYA